MAKAGDMSKELEAAEREQAVTAVKEAKKAKTKCAVAAKQSSKSKSALGQQLLFFPKFGKK